MAAFSTSLSSSHAVLGLGFSANCKQKREYYRGQHGRAFPVVHKPRNLAGSRLLVQNSSMPDEDSVVLRVRSGDEFYGVASFQFSSLNGEAAELGAMHKNEGRSQLLRNLSEANQHIRTLQHELCWWEIFNVFSCERKKMQLRIPDVTFLQWKKNFRLSQISQEISRQGVKPGTPKINGRYIHSHLASRLQEMQKILNERIKNFYVMQTRSIDLVYYGMAEDVQIMGSFDGWTRGDQMSPESTGTFTKFSTAMKLRPGRYEIKFLVDGEWQLSPDLPTVGEGLTMNNLLIVEQF